MAHADELCASLRDLFITYREKCLRTEALHTQTG